jgi:CHAD domain-containing protein
MVGFHFEKNESVSSAIRRLGTDRTAKSLRCLARADEFEAIHEVRKEIKKLRALLRLVREKAPRRDYRSAQNALRAAAARLAGLRDASVKLQTLAGLLDKARGRVRRGLFNRFRAGLEKRCRAEANRLWDRQAAEEVRALLVKVAQRLAELRVEGRGWSVIAPGIEAGYRAGRKTWLAAARHPSADQFHKWRKRAKVQWCQVRLLRRTRPGRLCALATELEELGELLGEAQDLVVLKQAVRRSRRQIPVAASRSLIRLIDSRRTVLCSAALELGPRIYAEKPRAFRRRLGRYWKAWRGG